MSLWICAYAHLPHCMSGSQKTTFCSWFSPLTMQVLEIELRSSGAKSLHTLSNLIGPPLMSFCCWYCLVVFLWFWQEVLVLKSHLIMYSWAGLDPSKYIDQGALKLKEITCLFLSSHSKIAYSFFLIGCSLWMWTFWYVYWRLQFSREVERIIGGILDCSQKHL